MSGTRSETLFSLKKIKIKKRRKEEFPTGILFKWYLQT